ncbi:conserved hypothetical protein [Leishmania mexicana MHOM/GT/2001/U1103]|uniref:Uncharacterized protein n=1 Tax=Leishmania mexicana (strain MHOM/GT/2001/U1103) TaxID=929439 RepID=E9B664_LEIMU|nr:conserved hypothetical protein [Leishmania mexicana MHOM/GT/2001/U1103]CBZ30735.1 conserved hypothetical protein [Leishmania mexicana MHOM/GT/2001/U1103]
MLLQDGLIAQQFAVIFRVAQLLQQAALSTSTSKRTYSIGAVREVGGAEVSALVALPGLRIESSSCGLAAAQAHTTSHARPQRDAKANAADRSVLQKHLQLPLVNADESVATLQQLGGILDEAARQLQASVDAQLVDFYVHLGKKANATLPAGTGGPRECATSARGSPQDRLTSRLISRPSSRQVPRSQHGDIGSSFRLNDEKGGASRTGSSGPCATFPLDADDTKKNPSAKDAAAGGVASVTVTPGVDAARIEGPVMPSVGIATPRSLNAQQPQRDTHSRVGTPSGLQSAPMTRRLEEERAAASELQSFFSLLLEAALRLTGGSAAAVYMDDAPQLAAGGTGGFLSRPAASTAAASGTAGSGRAQFLHCVAHSQGNFPSSISYAVSNVLTTVVTTGVAVNVHYSESSLLRLGVGANSGPGDLDSARHPTAAGGGITATDGAGRRLRNDSSGCSHRTLLDMYNGVVVPIKGIGCLVLANKTKTTAFDVTAPRFSIFDEHVAWSAALLSEAVLHRYERQLLLRVAWSPSCVSALRPYIQENWPLRKSANPLPSCDGPPTMPGRRGLQSRISSKRLITRASNAAANLSAADVDNAAVSALVFDPQNDIFSKTLTMVRTGDPKVLKALPSRLHTSSPIRSCRRPINAVISAVAAEAAAPGSSAKLNDEEVFHAAAEYITNLESLWHRTISESNTMHTMVERYNNQMRKQEETIALLEAKVRELSMQMMQLERRGNFTRLSAV